MTIDRQKFNQKLDRLTAKNKQILDRFLAGKTDEEIRQGLNLASRDSVRQHISKIGRIFQLNNECGANYRYRDELIKIFSTYQPDRVALRLRKQSKQPVTIEYPTGAVPLGSPFYIDRVEADCVRAIEIPGTLIRIEGPRLTGKTSLVLRVLDLAIEHYYTPIHIDLRSIETESLGDIGKFLKWLCVQVGKQLKLESKIDEYWDVTGAISSCTEYFEEYLLVQTDRPILLGLDEVDRIFLHPQVAEDFLGMLRSWHDRCQIESVWHKLRLIVAHSTEIYIPLNINKSPFNVGIPITLPEFTATQIEHLANLHQLTESPTLVEQLMSLIGGQPYLVRLALYHLSQSQITLTQLIKEAPTEGGIYRDRLSHYWDLLSQSSTLLTTFQQTISSPEPMQLSRDRTSAYQLQSMGLVKIQGDLITPSCNLYRQYFLNR